MNDTEKNRKSNAITISRTFFDLTHLLSQDIPIYPGDSMFVSTTANQVIRFIVFRPYLGQFL